MRWLRNPRAEPWTLDGVAQPWAGPSIYDFVSQQLERRKQSGWETPGLPDESRINESDLHFAAGALDGLFGGSGEQVANQTAEAIRTALVRLLAKAQAQRLTRFYQLLMQRRALDVADHALQRLTLRVEQVERAAQVARLLVRRAPDREPVKFGVALLSLVGDLAVDGSILLTVGSHDEFTLFAVVTLQNLGADDRTLWELAKRARGWGRIHAVGRLKGTTDPEIRAWMLREGFRNWIMDDYLAWICATTADLAGELAAAQVDEALFLGATEILSAMAGGGPAEGLRDYADAPRALGRWLDHAEARHMTTSVVSALDKLAASKEVPSDIAARINALRGSESALAAIEAGLAIDEEAEFAVAYQAAAARGLDAREPLLKRMRTGQGYATFEVLRTVQESELDEVLATMERRLDLEALATGPSDQPVTGPTFMPQQELATFVSTLGSYPGRGTEFVLAAIASPLLYARRSAIETIRSWNASQSPEIQAALRRARENEPDDAIRSLFDDAIVGLPKTSTEPSGLN